MKIKEIAIEKSRTIEVAGLVGRDAYRKITVRMSADIEDGISVEDQRNALSDEIDRAIKNEVDKINAAKKSNTENWPFPAGN